MNAWIARWGCEHKFNFALLIANIRYVNQGVSLKNSWTGTPISSEWEEINFKNNGN